MWALVRRLRDSGVTIILTTHYIDEAEEMADRIGVINKGELIVVEEKTALMKKLGKKQLTLNLPSRWRRSRRSCRDWHLALKAGGHELEYTFDASRGAHRHPGAAAAHERSRHRLQGSEHAPELARGYLRQPGERENAPSAKS